MKIDTGKYKVVEDKKFKLSDHDTDVNKKELDDATCDLELQQVTEEIEKEQYKLYAEAKQALLIVLQGMDGSGKDGTIKHIMKGINVQGVNVFSFKQPDSLELKRDYLWRHHIRVPLKGQITIFNRSHYENVLIVRVHPEMLLGQKLPGINKASDVNEDFWESRFKHINGFEQTLIDNGTQVLKFFLHISKDEQKERFLKRIDNRKKNWKFSPADIAERAYWDQYQDAYEQAIRHTATKQAPWYVIPADDKSFAHLLIGTIILNKLKEMDPEYPTVNEEDERLMAAAKEKLMKE